MRKYIGLEQLAFEFRKWCKVAVDNFQHLSVPILYFIDQCHPSLSADAIKMVNKQYGQSLTNQFLPSHDFRSYYRLKHPEFNIAKCLRLPGSFENLSDYESLNLVATPNNWLSARTETPISGHHHSSKWWLDIRQSKKFSGFQYLNKLYTVHFLGLKLFSELIQVVFFCRKDILKLGKDQTKRW